MARRKIVTYPDPILKKPSQEVLQIDSDIRTLVNDMADTMYAVPGIGLAAPQIGYNKRIIIFDTERKDLEEGLSEKEKIKNRNLMVLINPEITYSEGKVISENEGCLSVPDLRSDIKRKSIVHVKGLDLDGNTISIEASETVSIVIQHEIDHLNGVLFVDYISALKREMYRRKRLKKLKKKEKKKRK